MSIFDKFFKKAYYLGKSEHLKTDAHIFMCEPPMEGNKFVVVSTTTTLLGPSTYVFPSTENGEVVKWLELDCSRRGVWTYEDVLYEAGYKVVKENA